MARVVLRRRDGSFTPTANVLFGLAIGLVLGRLFSLDMYASEYDDVVTLLEMEHHRSSAAVVLDLPAKTKNLIINIGSNIDPIYPKVSQGPCALSVAFEPVVPFQVHKHPQIKVVPAAVSDVSGLNTMYTFNKIGVSSSLSKPAKNAYWNVGKQRGEAQIVPVIPMVDVVRAIPENVSVDLIMTDAQGYDFTMVSSAIEEIRDRKFPYLKTEVYLDNVATYSGVENDLCRNWLPMMMANGYTFVQLEQNKEGYRSQSEALESCARQATKSKTAGLSEFDAYWVLSSLKTIPDAATFQYDKVAATTQPDFAEAEYQACHSIGQ